MVHYIYMRLKVTAVGVSLVVLFGAAVYVYFQTLPPQSLPTGSDTDSEDMPESVPVSGISAQPTQDDTISEERLPDSPVTVDVPASTDPPISSDQDSAIPDAPTSVDIFLENHSNLLHFHPHPHPHSRPDYLTTHPHPPYFPSIRLSERTDGFCSPLRRIRTDKYRKDHILYIKVQGFEYWSVSLPPEVYNTESGTVERRGKPNCREGWIPEKFDNSVYILDPTTVDEIIILVDGKENRYRLSVENEFHTLQETKAVNVELYDTFDSYYYNNRLPNETFGTPKFVGILFESRTHRYYPAGDQKVPKIRLGEERGGEICWPFSRDIRTKTYRKNRTLYIETLGFEYSSTWFPPEIYEGMYNTESGMDGFYSQKDPCRSGWTRQRKYASEDIRIENPTTVDEIIILVDGKENRYRLSVKDNFYTLWEIEAVNVKLYDRLHEYDSPGNLLILR